MEDRLQISKVVDSPAITRVPALATNKVAGVAPRNGVLASRTHGVVGSPATIGPPRVTVAVVVPCGAWSSGSAHEQRLRLVAGLGDFDNALEVRPGGSWGAHDASDGRQGIEKGGAADHLEWC